VEYKVLFLSIANQPRMHCICLKRIYRRPHFLRNHWIYFHKIFSDY